MKLTEVVLTESRGLAMGLDQAVELLKGRFSHGWDKAENGVQIWRGAQSHPSQIALYDTVGKYRENANTEPFVNQIIDNSPHWKGWPKRSESLICSTNKEYAEGYGKVRLVIPENNTMIGVVEDEDFWNAFDGDHVGLPIVNQNYGVGELERIVRSSLKVIRLYAVLNEELERRKGTHWKEIVNKINQLRLDTVKHDIEFLKKADAVLEHVVAVAGKDVGADVYNFMADGMHGIEKALDNADKSIDEFIDTVQQETGARPKFIMTSARNMFDKAAGLENILNHGFLKVFGEILKPREEMLKKVPIEQLKKNNGEVWFSGQAILINPNILDVVQAEMKR